MASHGISQPLTHLAVPLKHELPGSPSHLLRLCCILVLLGWHPGISAFKAPQVTFSSCSPVVLMVWDTLHPA